jgi:hypothetical protein
MSITRNINSLCFSKCRSCSVNPDGMYINRHDLKDYGVIQARSQTMNTVGAAASSADTYTYIVYIRIQ